MESGQQNSEDIEESEEFRDFQIEEENSQTDLQQLDLEFQLLESEFPEFFQHFNISLDEFKQINNVFQKIHKLNEIKDTIWNLQAVENIESKNIIEQSKNSVESFLKLVKTKQTLKDIEQKVKQEFNNQKVNDIISGIDNNILGNVMKNINLDKDVKISNMLGKDTIILIKNQQKKDSLAKQLMEGGLFRNQKRKLQVWEKENHILTMLNQSIKEQYQRKNQEIQDQEDRKEQNQLDQQEQEDVQQQIYNIGIEEFEKQMQYLYSLANDNNDQQNNEDQNTFQQQQQQEKELIRKCESIQNSSNEEDQDMACFLEEDNINTNNYQDEQNKEQEKSLKIHQTNENSEIIKESHFLDKVNGKIQDSNQEQKSPIKKQQIEYNSPQLIKITQPSPQIKQNINSNDSQLKIIQFQKQQQSDHTLFSSSQQQSEVLKGVKYNKSPQVESVQEQKIIQFPSFNNKANEKQTNNIEQFQQFQQNNPNELDDIIYDVQSDDNEDQAYPHYNMTRIMNELDLNSDTLSSKFKEIKYLLQLFGIPYLEAPAEAEAQCAYLNHHNLVDAVITDDSDVFLFGAKLGIKGLFSKDKNNTQLYSIELIEKELGLDRNKLILLAYFLGCDYTLGVKGIGIVNAIEIIEAFDSFEAVRRFSQWANKADVLLEKSEEFYQNISQQELNYKLKHKNYKKQWEFQPDFPNPEVQNAFLNPKLDKSLEQFSWAKPAFQQINEFLKSRIGWSDEYINQLLEPLKRDLQVNKQFTLDKWLNNDKIATINSVRIQKSLIGLKDKKKTEEIPKDIIKAGVRLKK